MEAKMANARARLGFDDIRLARRLIYRFVVCLALSLVAVAASATTYIYDSQGRMVAATDDAGNSARYNYDVIGNLTQIDRYAAGQLAIFTFTPTRGIASTTVKIRGQGFSTTVSQNAVKFNGTAATVSAATATEITTKVPSGATTGPISVTVSSSTATSVNFFTVDPASAAPTITSVSPLVATVGTQISLTGTRLLPVSGQTTVALNGLPTAPTTITNTQASFAVGSPSSSGKVSISTPYGVGKSTQDVVVVPPDYAIGQIKVTKRLAINAAAQTFALNTEGDVAAVLVDATSGDYLSLQANSMGNAVIPYRVFGKNNEEFASGYVNASEPSAHLPQIRTTGTYLIIFQPMTYPANWNLAIEKAQTITVNGSLVSQSVSNFSQSRRYLFTATQGQNLGVGAADIAIPEEPDAWSAAGSVSVLGASNQQISGAGCYRLYGGCQVNLPALNAGTYQILVRAPSYGTMSYTLGISPDQAAALSINVAKSIDLARYGQNARFTFSGTAGQAVAFQVANQLMTPPDHDLGTYYTITNPDGSVLASQNIKSTGLIKLFPLTATGTYKIFMDPAYGEKTTAQITMTDGTVNRPVVNGADGTHAASAPGQSIYFTFVATANQNLGLGFTNNTGGSGYWTIQAFNPLGQSAAYSTSCASGTYVCQLNFPNTLAGTYSVVVTPSSPDAIIGFTTSLSSDVVGALSIDAPQSMVLSRYGQNGRYSFNGTAGQVLAVQIYGTVGEPVGSSPAATIYKPDGTLFKSAGLYTAAPLILPPLPATGQYQILFDPTYGGKITTNAAVWTGSIGAPSVDGPSASYSVTDKYRVVYASFQAAAGQNIGIGISNLVVPNAFTNGYAQMIVYKPDGTQAGVMSCYRTYAGCQFNLQSTVAGTYRLTLAPPPEGNGTMTFDLTESTDLTGTLQVGTTKLVSITRPGQNGRYTFTASAGKSGTLQLSGQSTTPANRAVNFMIYNPDGTTLASTSSNTTTGSLTFSNLPTTGTYTVLVDPGYGEAYSGQLLLSIN